MSIILDMIFWARFIYIKTQFYKTEGIAYGNDNHYFSEFLIRDDKGYNITFISIIPPLYQKYISILINTYISQYNANTIK